MRVRPAILFSGLLFFAGGCGEATKASPSADAASTTADAPAHDMAAMNATPANPSPASPSPTGPAQATPAEAKPIQVADFTLSDQNGKSHHLYDMKDKAAVVLIWQGVGCPIVEQMTPAINEAYKRYSPKNIAFLMINSNIQDTPDMIKGEVEKFDLGPPVVKDAGQKVASALGVARTAEVVVIDPKKNWRVLYHGPLDDRLTYGRARAKADNNWVADVLDATLAGKDVAYVSRPADGCIINYPDQAKQG